MAHAQSLVKDIQVRGNQTVNREAILAQMSLKVGGGYSETDRAKDEASILRMGFFSAARIVPISDDAGTGWILRVEVEEYPTIKEVRVTGNTVVKTEDILAKLPESLRPGHIFNAAETRPASQAISEMYAAKGYSAQVVAFEPLEGSPQTLSLSLLEARVGDISVQGNRLTKDRTIRKLIRTRPGDVYSKNRWIADLNRIYGTGWFEADGGVVPEVTPADELGVLDLSVGLKEARTGTFNVGLQLDPQNSLAGLIRYSQANVGGTGQSFGVSFLQSTQGVGPSVDLDYTNPFIDNKNTTLRASLYSRVVFRFQGGLFGSGSSTSFTKDDQYYERRNGFSLGISRPVNDYVNRSFALRAEDVTTENVKQKLDSNGNPVNNYILQNGQVVVGTLGLSVERRDVPINPSRGYWLQMSLEPGYSNIDKVGGLTSDASILGPHLFGKASVEYRRYFSKGPARELNLDATRNVLAFRVRVGTIVGQVPFFEQYFAGGAESVRGYQEDRFWGRQTLTTTLEYRYPLQKSFSLIGFVDYGGAWGGYGGVNDFSQSSGPQLHLGYGPGLSFRAGPLGNIQLYLGFNEDGKTRTHFLIGNSF